MSQPIDRRFEGLRMAKSRRRTRKRQANDSRRKVTRIDVLPNDVLLEIFVFYMSPSYRGIPRIRAWQSLVHVCRRWRGLVYESPRRLNLQLVCTPETPARDTLDIWPALPLLIKGNITLSSGADNIIVALQQSHRVCEINLVYLAGQQLEQVLAAMEVTFPKLTELRFKSHDEKTPPVPDSFLGGSAPPRLRHLELFGIPFAGLPKLLWSATCLNYLKLSNIPHSGYFSPESFVALLSVLSCLETLFLEFQSPRSHPDLETRPPPPSERSILPALKRLHFKGVTEYLEDLVICIDAPQLKLFYLSFFNQIDFDCSRLAQFINSTPTLRALDEAHVQFDHSTVSLTLRSRTSRIGFGELRINISCREPDWQLSSIEQVCNSVLPPPSTIKHLYIEREHSQLVWNNDAIEGTLWLELLLPFTAVKNLYLSEEFAPGIAAALQALVGDRITEVLPRLRNIFVEELEPSGPFQENIGWFVAARKFFSQPIGISVWDCTSDGDSARAVVGLRLNPLLSDVGCVCM